jgi:hypothetical protein
MFSCQREMVLLAIIGETHDTCIKMRKGMWQVRPVAWLSIVLYPVGRVVTALSTSLLKLLGLKSSGYGLTFFLLECTSVVPVQFKSCCHTYIGWLSLESPSYECGRISIAIMMPTRLMSPLDFILMPFAVMSSVCTYPSPC